MFFWKRENFVYETRCMDRGYPFGRFNNTCSEKIFRPLNLRTVRGFLRLTNYIRCFVQPTLAEPITWLTTKEYPFVWTDGQQWAFDELKRRFTPTPVLIHFDPTKLVKITH